MMKWVVGLGRATMVASTDPAFDDVAMALLADDPFVVPDSDPCFGSAQRPRKLSPPRRASHPTSDSLSSLDKYVTSDPSVGMDPCHKDQVVKAIQVLMVGSATGRPFVSPASCAASYAVAAACADDDLPFATLPTTDDISDQPLASSSQLLPYAAPPSPECHCRRFAAVTDPALPSSCR